jgi:hypothetical protein
MSGTLAPMTMNADEALIEVTAPPLDQLLRKCCKNAADQTSITYLIEPVRNSDAINAVTA